jgi:hypothetical protein
MDIEDIKKQRLSPEEQNARRSAKAERLPTPRPKPVLRLVIKDANPASIEGISAGSGDSNGSKGGAQ